MYRDVPRLTGFTIPHRLLTLFKEWSVEARRVNFNRHDYASAFEEFGAELFAHGEVGLHRTLVLWCAILREEALASCIEPATGAATITQIAA